MYMYKYIYICVAGNCMHVCNCVYVCNLRIQHQSYILNEMLSHSIAGCLLSSNHGPLLGAGSDTILAVALEAEGYQMQVHMYISWHSAGSVFADVSTKLSVCF